MYSRPVERTSPKPLYGPAPPVAPILQLLGLASTSLRPARALN